MAALIFEIRRKHSDQVEYVRISKFPVRIGRGYDNDLILDDPYLSPCHAVLTATDSGWLLEDCNSENGIRMGETNTLLQDSAPVQAGELFTLGETQVRMVTPDLQVEPTRIQHNVAWYLHLLAHPAIAWSLCLLACLAASFISYMQSSAPVDFQTLAITVAVTLFMQLLWSGGWAFAGRTLKKKPFFHRQLTVFAIYILLSIPLDILTEHLEYLTSSVLIGELFSYLMTMAPFAVVLYLSLWIATAMQKRRRVMVAGLVTVLSGLTAFIIDMESSAFVDTQEYSTVLKSPYAPTMPPVSIESFFADSARLIDSIEIEDE